MLKCLRWIRQVRLCGVDGMEWCGTTIHAGHTALDNGGGGACVLFSHMAWGEVGNDVTCHG
ncbi:hypothetical protein HanRHA438_Chr14g0647661 [Helianthus annuus]|nr:hypothetical protein HanRHA438_Chr14g0647661 [Helianthus annuus]